MKIRDLFVGWEGPGALVVRKGFTVLVLDGQAIETSETWFLRIVEATDAERRVLDDAGYLIRDA